MMQSMAEVSNQVQLATQQQRASTEQVVKARGVAPWRKQPRKSLLPRLARVRLPPTWPNPVGRKWKRRRLKRTCGMQVCVRANLRLDRVEERGRSKNVGGGASGVQITWNKKWSIKYTTISRTTIPPMFLAFKISTPE